MSDYELEITPEVELPVTAMVPTGGRNGWREITFYARFKVSDNAKSKESGRTIIQAMEQDLVSVDFGNLKMRLLLEDGTEITPKDFALRNQFLQNAMIAVYRDDIVTKNIEGKASRGSR